MEKIYVVMWGQSDDMYQDAIEFQDEITKIFKTKQQAKDWIFNEIGVEVGVDDRVRFDVTDSVNYRVYWIEEHDLE